MKLGVKGIPRAKLQIRVYRKDTQQWEDYGVIKFSKNKLLSWERVKRRIKKWLMS